MTRKHDKKPVYVKLSKATFDNISAFRTYFHLESFDATVVVLRIAASSGDENGISEAQLAQELGYSRPTMNRILKRLLDTGHIVVKSDVSPRRYTYNFEYANATYGEFAQRERARLMDTIIEGSIGGLLTILRHWQASQFEKD